MLRYRRISFFTLLSFFAYTAALPSFSFARDLNTGLTLSKELSVGGRGNEFISGDYPGAVLMKVNLWGAVQKPGIHYIPARTDLLTLMSYAGGPTERAQMDDVVIKRSIAGKERSIEIDANDIIYSSGAKSPVLEPNDVVVIATKTPAVSNDTLAIMTVVSGVLSIALVGFIISNQFQKK